MQVQPSFPALPQSWMAPAATEDVAVLTIAEATEDAAVLTIAEPDVLDAAVLTIAEPEAPATEASTAYFTDLIEVFEQLEKVGIILSGASTVISRHKYTYALLDDLEKLMATTAVAQSFIHDSLEHYHTAITSTAVRSAKDMLVDILQVWRSLKSQVETMVNWKAAVAEISDEDVQDDEDEAEDEDDGPVAPPSKKRRLLDE